MLQRFWRSLLEYFLRIVVHFCRIRCLNHGPHTHKNFSVVAAACCELPVFLPFAIHLLTASATTVAEKVFKAVMTNPIASKTPYIFSYFVRLRSSETPFQEQKKTSFCIEQDGHSSFCPPSGSRARPLAAGASDIQQQQIVQPHAPSPAPAPLYGAPSSGASSSALLYVGELDFAGH